MSPNEQIFIEVAIGGIAAGVVGLMGVLVGARLEKQRWIAEKKRSEYRKLLTTLTETFTAILKIGVHVTAMGPTEQRALGKLEVRASVVLLDRLFIDDEVKKLKLVKKWNKAVQDYSDTLNNEAFANACGLIAADIRKSAGALMTDSGNWYERFERFINEIDRPA